MFNHFDPIIWSVCTGFCEILFTKYKVHYLINASEFKLELLFDSENGNYLLVLTKKTIFGRNHLHDFGTVLRSVLTVAKKNGFGEYRIFRAYQIR